MRQGPVVTAVMLLGLPVAALAGQAPRFEAGVGLAAPTRLRLPETFENRGMGPKVDFAVSRAVGAGVVRWRVGAGGQRIKAGRDYLWTLAAPAGVGVDMGRGVIVPTVSLAVVPHWTRYSRRFALNCDVPNLGGQHGFIPGAEPDCTRSTVGIGATASAGIRFATASRFTIGAEFQATHLPGVSTVVAGLVRVSP